MFIPSALFIAAMIQVESAGQLHAVRGQHYGVLQVGPQVIADVNRILRERGDPKRYRHSDMMRENPSIEVFHIYLSHYCTAERLGHEPTERDAALTWRYGPTGYRHLALHHEAYWRCVSANMAGISSRMAAAEAARPDCVLAAN